MKSRIKKIIASNRKNIIFKSIDVFCQKYHNAFENSNYDFDANGEWRVLVCINKVFSVKTIFDVGANKGLWALTASKIFSNAQIHCFEIIPDTFNTLADNLGGRLNIFLNNVGLSNKEVMLDVNYFNGKSELSTIFESDHVFDSKVVNCKVIKGDEYCRLNNIEIIDFLKIDTEGSEHLVLEGLEIMIKQRAIKIIQFEYGRININTKFLLKDFYKLFNENGYKVGKIYPNHVDFSDYSLHMENFIGPNFIAIDEKLNNLIDMLANK